MTSTSIEYEVVVRGRIGPRLQYDLGRLEVTSSEPEVTRLRGWIPDQAALHGTLERIRDLGLELMALNRIG
jgi:hypothetical protein